MRWSRFAAGLERSSLLSSLFQAPKGCRTPGREWRSSGLHGAGTRMEQRAVSSMCKVTERPGRYVKMVDAPMLIPDSRRPSSAIRPDPA